MGIAGRPTRSTAVAVSGLGFSGSTDPVDRCSSQSSRDFLVDRPGRPLRVAELSGFLGRPTGRPSVVSSPKTVYLFHFFSLSLSHIFSPMNRLLFSQKFPLTLSTLNLFKFLLNPVWIPSLGVGSSFSGPPLHQIRRISGLLRSRVLFFTSQVKIIFFLLFLISSFKFIFYLSRFLGF